MMQVGVITGPVHSSSDTANQSWTCSKKIEKTKSLVYIYYLKKYQSLKYLKKQKYEVKI